MRRKDEIARSIRLRAALMSMLFLLGLLTYIIPGRSAFYTDFLGLPLLLTVITGVVCGIVPGGFSGALIPCVASLVLKQLDFMPDAVAGMISLSAAGLTAGIFYRKFKTGLGAAIGAVLIYLPLFALSKGGLELLRSSSYTFMDFVKEGILGAYPGLLLPIVITPLLVLLFRKSGLMETLWGEERT